MKERQQEFARTGQKEEMKMNPFPSHDPFGSTFPESLASSPEPSYPKISLEMVERQQKIARTGQKEEEIKTNPFPGHDALVSIFPESSAGSPEPSLHSYPKISPEMKERQQEIGRTGKREKKK